MTPGLATAGCLKAPQVVVGPGPAVQRVIVGLGPSEDVFVVSLVLAFCYLGHWQAALVKISAQNFGSDEIIEAGAHQDDKHKSGSLTRLRRLVGCRDHDGGLRVITQF